MKIVGYVFLAVIAAGALTGLVMTAASLPDIKRYLKIRAM